MDSTAAIAADMIVGVAIAGPAMPVKSVTLKRKKMSRTTWEGCLLIFSDSC